MTMHAAGPERSRRISGPAVWLAAGVLVAGCQVFPSPKPAEELWPNAAVPEVQPWQPVAGLETNFAAFADVIEVERVTLDGRAVSQIRNLNPAASIQVFYRDMTGSIQAVRIEPGATLPVATPREILSVE